MDTAIAANLAAVCLFAVSNPRTYPIRVELSGDKLEASIAKLAIPTTSGLALITKAKNSLSIPVNQNSKKTPTRTTPTDRQKRDRTFLCGSRWIKAMTVSGRANAMDRRMNASELHTFHAAIASVLSAVLASAAPTIGLVVITTKVEPVSGR